jgi:hypothetical protein
MDNDLKQAVEIFISEFEQVFDKDWDYTKEQLGIYDDTEEQKQAALEMGLQPIYLISPDGTFLNPKVEDEVDNWGYRGGLLREYRKLKELLSTSK